MFKKTLILLTIILIIFPTQAIAQSDDQNYKVNIVALSLQIIGFIFFIGILVGLSLSIYNSYQANKISSCYAIKPSPDELDVVARKKILLKYNYLPWLHGAGFVLFLLFVPAFIFPTIFIIYLTILLSLVILIILKNNKRSHELNQFDVKNPETKKKMKNSNTKIFKIDPEFNQKYEKYIKLKKIYIKIFAISIFALIISMLSWAITVFGTCCDQTVTN